MKTEYQVGDRVRYVYPGTHRYKQEGTILVIHNKDIGVQFDNPVRGHTLRGRCPDGYGWWTIGDKLELIETLPDLDLNQLI